MWNSPKSIQNEKRPNKENKIGCMYAYSCIERPETEQTVADIVKMPEG